ncbi:hypothetical protein F5887DRAFT_928701 [Amanita rubescens]|nr:hypothetical protein F5887DRAFT_928701 [Amanita rubescens]
MAKGQECEEPVGRAVNCPACQHAKIACMGDRVWRGDLGKAKRRKLEKGELGTSGDLGSILGVLEKMLVENREFHQAVLRESWRHQMRVERLLTEVVDPTYAYVPAKDRDVEYEWKLETNIPQYSTGLPAIVILSITISKYPLNCSSAKSWSMSSVLTPTTTEVNHYAESGLLQQQ